MSKALEMIFRTSDNKSFRLLVDDAREDITPAEIRTAMEAILAKGIFTVPKGEIVAVDKAKLISKDVEELTL